MATWPISWNEPSRSSLALWPAVSLFLGVGHIYVGRIGRGLALLVIGWVIYIPFIISLLFFWLIWPILITILLGIVLCTLGVVDLRRLQSS